MDKVVIEFFHDVICSFCFPMSYRMRELKKIYPEVEIVHRSFALVKADSDFDLMFGSRKAAKAEIMSHWAHANANDDLHRFNIEGMKNADFLFPGSMKGLRACKAAYFIGGDVLYWDLFDALQNALFVQNLNIEEDAVMENCVENVGINVEEWRQYFLRDDTKKAVEEDLKAASNYGIYGAPCLVINGKQKISGAQPLSTVIEAIRNVKASDSSAGASCKLVDGEMKCD